MNKLFLMAISVIAMSLAMSCQNNEVIDIAKDATAPTQEKAYDFSKDVTIAAGQTRATLRIHADSEAELAAYTAENFRLVEVNNAESLEDALVRNRIVNTNERANAAEADDELLENEAEVTSSLAFELVEVSNKVEGKRYAVSFFHPESNSRASWQYFTHYSTAGQDLEPHCDVARHSFWRRVYYGVKYRRTSSSNWSVIQNEWRKLSNNQTMSYTKTPCYQYRTRVKTKKSSAYTVSFY